MGFMSSNSDMPSSMRGIISLVSAASMAYDDSLERIVGVKLVAVGRGKVSRVRAVKDGLLVADGWSPLFDNIPEASYKHQLYVGFFQSQFLLSVSVTYRCQITAPLLFEGAADAGR